MIRHAVYAIVMLAAIELAYSQPAPSPGKDHIGVIVQQLGEESFSRREAAAKELVGLGSVALPALRSAFTSENLELRRRARQLEGKIIQMLRVSKSTGLEMGVIEPNEFDMGSPNNERTRRPDEAQHRVKITKLFLIGVTEVTQAEYERVMKDNPSWFASAGKGKDRVAGQKTEKFPVEQVTWFDAVEFCNRLSKLDGLTPYYQIVDVKKEGANIRSASVTPLGGAGYRLPTEAEWECACRAGSTRLFHFGDRNSGREANIKPGTTTISYASAPEWNAPNRTVSVGSYAPNAIGLRDMHGNVAEWCADWYDKDYYAKSPASDPQGPAQGLHRVVRGGSWLVNQANCRSASRFWSVPGEASNHVGFRVARTP